MQSGVLAYEGAKEGLLYLAMRLMQLPLRAVGVAVHETDQPQMAMAVRVALVVAEEVLMLLEAGEQEILLLCLHPKEIMAAIILVPGLIKWAAEEAVLAQ